jgi:hypothetical protein
MVGEIRDVETAGLVVNGSLTARRVLWKGTQGTVGDKAGGVFDAGCHYTNGASGCAAEYVNFSPEGYVGRFNMNADQSVSNSVSTVELPPVY